jgi:hypothetical protein
LASDVEIDRALNALDVTLNDQRVEALDVERLDAIVVESLGGEPLLRVSADVVEPERIAWMRDDALTDVGRVERVGDGRWTVARCEPASSPPPDLTVTLPAGTGFRDEPSTEHVAILPRAPVAAALAAPALIVTLMLISEIASQPTFAPGVESSSWTPLRGVAALIAGTGAYGGSFDVPAILGGLVVLALGPAPAPAPAMALGVAWALLVMQAIGVNLLVGLAQSEPTVYESLPPWGWWAAHGAYGLALGGALAVLGRRDAA